MNRALEEKAFVNVVTQPQPYSEKKRNSETVLHDREKLSFGLRISYLDPKSSKSLANQGLRSRRP